ncbi:hypothetical protein EU642_21975 [Salmonella enterica]|nr:hypothetical protein [Salmonella enterica]EAR6391520.1 hypothetical protein [Salmonella enterica]EAV1285284.1 hypothetical protein [Salmonella enterica]
MLCTADIVPTAYLRDTGTDLAIQPVARRGLGFQNKYGINPLFADGYGAGWCGLARKKMFEKFNHKWPPDKQTAITKLTRGHKKKRQGSGA